jgi:predicted aspartyl protease
MGETKTKITLINAADFENAHAGLIKEAEVRQVVVDAVVDTGAGPLVINEALRAKLGLRIMETRTVGVAGGGRQDCAIASCVLVYWQERYTSELPMVLPHETETLLGFIALEAMDLRVCPLEQKVEGAHGAQWVRYIR